MLDRWAADVGPQPRVALHAASAAVTVLLQITVRLL